MIKLNNPWIFFNGQVIRENQACIGVRNMAFNYGLGCYEGIKAYWNQEKSQLYVFRMQEHYARLLRSCKILNINIPYTVQELCSITVRLLQINKYTTTVYIRPIAYKGANQEYPQLLDPDNQLVIYILPMESLIGKEAIKVCTSSWTRVMQNMIPPMAKATACYLNSALASTEAITNGFDEAILLTINGNVSEGPGENIFILKNRVLITPPITDDILEGITRDTVIRFAKNDLGINTIIRSIPRPELYTSDEAFFTGTGIEIKPIIEIDRKRVGNGSPGIITNRLKQLYSETVHGENAKYSIFNTPVYTSK
jgi:branched-chain amino acid aminotransferase